MTRSAVSPARSSRVLYDDGLHRNLVLDGLAAGAGVQANLHLVQHGDAALVLDPGGHGLFANGAAEVLALLGPARLEGLFLSHQDPDVVAALNGWLLVSDATAYVSALYMRFIPHFGLDELVSHRLRPIPDEGLRLDLAGAPLVVLPAHFLHSEGNFQLYDPRARILYTGDLGASFDASEAEVRDFDAHVPHMLAFHRRYMASGRVLRAWADMVQPLDVEVLAPQHGAVLRGPGLVRRFLDWCRTLECGIDLLPEAYALPREADA